MITLDHVDISKWKLKTVGQTVHPATPDIRTNTMDIPGMEGSWDFGSSLGQRTFTIPLYIQEPDVYQRQRLMREFVAFLLDDYGRPRTLKLTFDYDPDKYYEAKLSTRIDPERLFRMNRFELSLVANKSHANFIVPSNKISWDADIPFINDVLWDMGETEFKITKPQTITLVYSGTKAIRAGFKLKGNGSNVSLSANGKTMSFGNMDNVTYVVDGETYTIKKNGEDSLVTANFIELLHGENKVSVSGSNLNLTFTEQLTYQFI